MQLSIDCDILGNQYKVINHELKGVWNIPLVSQPGIETNLIYLTDFAFDSMPVNKLIPMT